MVVVGEIGQVRFAIGRVGLLDGPGDASMQQPPLARE